MEVTDRQAQACVGLEATVWGDHDDAWWFERIVLGKEEFSMVVAPCVLINVWSLIRLLIGVCMLYRNKACPLVPSQHSACLFTGRRYYIMTQILNWLYP